MEILAVILAFLQVADIAMKVKSAITSDGQENKNKIADLFDEIGNLMSEVADDLTNNIYPHDKCAKMAGLLHKFKTALTGKLDDSDITRLEDVLDRASRVEQLFGDLNRCSPENKHQQLLILRQSAGTFNAEALLLRI